MSQMLFNACALMLKVIANHNDKSRFSAQRRYPHLHRKNL